MASEFNPNPYRRPNATWWQGRLEAVMEDEALVYQAAGDEMYLCFLQDERIHGIRYLMDQENDEAKNSFLDAFRTRAAYEEEKFSRGPDPQP